MNHNPLTVRMGLFLFLLAIVCALIICAVIHAGG